MTRTPLTRRQCHILWRLEHGEWRTDTELAAELGLRRRASLTRVLRTLERGGWVEVEPLSPDDTSRFPERRYRHREMAARKAVR